MSVANKNASDVVKKGAYCEDSTDSDNETDRRPLLRRMSTSKCVGRLPVVKEGHLMKQTRSFQRWQRRYFRLRGRTLYYAKDKESQLWDECDLEHATFAECGARAGGAHGNTSFQVITPHRCLVLCAESRSEMEAWAEALRGALHRGGGVADLVARLSSGEHHWYAATHARPTFCNVCREGLGALGTAPALACELCKLKAHKRCAARAPPACKWTTLASLGPHLVEDDAGNIIMPHQWLEGNLPVAAKCDVCDKTCGSVLRLQDYRCVWCRVCVHAGCRPGWRARCSLGVYRASIVPPTRLHSVGPDDAWLPDRPPNASPLIVFVNSRSGDNQGVKFLRRFRQLLNPAQVFELGGGGGGGGGPRLGLRLFRHFAPLRVLVCSGDGSVGWVLQEVDKLDMHRQVQTAVLPLGTGNDLARVLGWGASCDDAAGLHHLLERYERASTKMLDRWSIMTYERALSAPPPPPAPPDLRAEPALLTSLQQIMQAGELSWSAQTALREGCGRLAGAGEHAGGGAARAAHRLRRALSLLLHARAHLAHDHAACKSWEPLETSDSEPEAPPAAEKGSNEKTEKEAWNSAARAGCALWSRADSVRRALRHLVATLRHAYPHQELGSSEPQPAAEGAAPAGAPAGGTAEGGRTLPVPRAFADSRRSSAVSAASLQPDDIPDVDEDLAKLISTNPPPPPPPATPSTLEVERPSPSDGSPCDTGSCRHPRDCHSSTLTIPNLVVSDDSDRRDSLIQGETYESDQLTIIDIDKPYTDDEHFQELSSPRARRKLSSVDLEVGADAGSDDGSELSAEFSLASDVPDDPPGGDGPPLAHIDSPEASDTTTCYNSETLHGESIGDDVSSMLGQEALVAMMGRSGDNETYTDDTTLLTSDTVSDLALDSRNPSLERTHPRPSDARRRASRPRRAADADPEKFGFENRVFYIENATKPEEQVIKYCSLAQFEEGNDIARRSFKKHLRKSFKQDAEESAVKKLLPKTFEEPFIDDSPKRTLLGSPKMHPASPKSKPVVEEDREAGCACESASPFPQVSVVVEPPSPAHSERAPPAPGAPAPAAGPTLEARAGRERERRQSDNPRLLADPEYGRFLSCSPAATRRISCGSLFKPGEPDLSTSASSVWGEGGAGRGAARKLPIINPLVALPAWPHVGGGGFVSQCLLANADALCAAVSPLMDPEDAPPDAFAERAVMNNYFGIGIDAKITLDFHNKREEHPEKCRSRARNYMWYGVLGSREWVNRTYRHLGQRVQLECDGRRIPLPELQGIVVLNIPSFMGGANFWGGTRADDVFLAPSFDDRVLEVVAVFGSAQMAASRLLPLQRHRIAQCRQVQIHILGEERVPVQVDGEAWLQPPGTLRIVHKGRAQMLCRSRALETSLRAWDEKQQAKSQSVGAGPAPAASRAQLSPAEARQLLALLDDLNTVVKQVKLSCISSEGAGASGAEGGAEGARAVGAARRAAALADALQDAAGRLLPPPALRKHLAALVDSCQELAELAGGGGAAGSLRAHLARVSVRDGHAYLHPDEPPKKESVRVWRARRSVSEGQGGGGGGGGGGARHWGTAEVGAWLRALQLGEYAGAFTAHDVTGRELLALARRDLRDLGVNKVGHVKRILAALKDLQ